MSEELDRLPPEIRKRCLRALYRICGREGLVPKSLRIPVCYDSTENPQCSGEFSDVWKGSYDGREVAAKVLRVYVTSDLKAIKKVVYLVLLVFVDELTASCSEVLQGGLGLEEPSSSECVAVARRYDGRKAIRDNVRMDEQWEYYRLPKG